ncbi:MAG: phosphoethanolamine transferase [Panacagrimonas sp.]
MQTRPVLAGTLLVACGYGLMRLGWQDTLEATLVYCLGSYVLASFCHHNGRALWLFRAWNLAFVIDLGIKAFLITVYKSRPDAAQVIEGISNTTSDESAEFLMNYWMLLGTYTLQLSVLAVLLILATRPVPGLPSSSRKGLVAVGAVFVLLHLNPTVRRANPLLFWPAQAATIEEFRANVETLRNKREIARASLDEWQPTYVGPARHTLGLVIGESTNRWNWQLYGYVRQTTPELQKLAGERAGELMVFRDVLSAASSTVSALRHMLTPRSLHDEGLRGLSDEQQPSVLMLARAAGYKVFWISNQHDRYITARFAEEADVMRLLNSGGVGSDRSLDEVLLPEWKLALADPAPRKLIVAHLMGAHAHYDLRCPDHFKHFESHQDEVNRDLEARGRSPWVRLKRDQYDDAMLYQDWVISRLLTQFKVAVRGDSATWLYTSDHGEEVGHTRNFTGHSPDEPGQVVPLLIWNSEPVDPETVRELERRPFQTDVLDWTLLDLMHLRTRHDQPQDRLLVPAFRPRKRRLHDGSEYQASGSAS